MARFGVSAFLFSMIAFNAITQTIEIYRMSCRKDVLFKLSADNSKLEAVLISTATQKYLHLCARMCLSKNTCKSFNYNAINKSCEILSQNKQEAGAEKLKEASGWKYYQPLIYEDSPRCRPSAGVEPCGVTQACDEVCSNPVGYQCRTLANIALGKATAQSSTCSYGYAARAVDGNTATNWLSNTCTHTCSGGWWRVDFGQTARVHSVRITNRGDCCGFRLSNFNIRIGESSDGDGGSNAACAMNQGISQGATVTYKCRPRLLGRYLYVQTNLADGLTLCEVQVFGEFI